MSRGITRSELVAWAERDGLCICLDVLPLVPIHGETLRAQVDCPLHKILAERWDSINSWETFNAARAEDRARVTERYPDVAAKMWPTATELQRDQK